MRAILVNPNSISVGLNSSLVSLKSTPNSLSIVSLGCPRLALFIGVRGFWLVRHSCVMKMRAM